MCVCVRVCVCVCVCVCERERERECLLWMCDVYKKLENVSFCCGLCGQADLHINDGP